MLGYETDGGLPDKYVLEKGKDKMGWRGRGNSCVFSFPSCLLKRLPCPAPRWLALSAVCAEQLGRRRLPFTPPRFYFLRDGKQMPSLSKSVQNR